MFFGIPWVGAVLARLVLSYSVIGFCDSILAQKKEIVKDNVRFIVQYFGYTEYRRKGTPFDLNEKEKKRCQYSALR